MEKTTADLVPFEALLESTNEGLYGINLEGRCTFLNRSGAAMLGKSSRGTRLIAGWPSLAATWRLAGFS